MSLYGLSYFDNPHRIYNSFHDELRYERYFNNDAELASKLSRGNRLQKGEKPLTPDERKRAIAYNDSQRLKKKNKKK